jgi:hypothetical protein
MQVPDFQFMKNGRIHKKSPPVTEGAFPDELSTEYSRQSLRNIKQPAQAGD